MFFSIQHDNYEQHQNTLDRMFSLRKRVFADELGWNVRTHDEREFDQYDALNPTYLIWANREHTKLYASIRLMPTTGPTLLYDVFRRTFPSTVRLSAPRIWEGTRACVDVAAIEDEFPNKSSSMAFSMLLLATTEFALDQGIHTIASNYEPQVLRIYRRAGVVVTELGRADGYGAKPVCCGTFAVTAASLERMRRKLGVNFPLYATQRPIRSALNEHMKRAA